MKLLILSLRRSGSTIVWKTFRQDKKLTCYDEPFGNSHINLPRPNRKNTNHELINLVKKDPVMFWQKYCPIDFSQELSEDMLDDQKCYLKFLLNTSEHVVCDLTRFCFKLKTLKEVCPDAYIVHLYRSPQAFVSSHILPSAPEAHKLSQAVVKVKRSINRSRFWSLRQGYDSWGYERIIGDSNESKFSTYLKDKGLFFDDFNSLPAYGKLLYLWKICYDKIEREGRDCFGDKFSSLPFEFFCRFAQEYMEKIYGLPGLEMPEFSFNRIRKSSPGFRAYDHRWEDMSNRLGFASIYDYPWMSQI